MQLQNNGIDFSIAAAVLKGVEGRAVGIEILLKAIGVVIETQLGELVSLEFLQTFGDGKCRCC